MSTGPVKPGQYKFWLRKNNAEVAEEKRKRNEEQMSRKSLLNRINNCSLSPRLSIKKARKLPKLKSPSSDHDFNRNPMLRSHKIDSKPLIFDQTPTQKNTFSKVVSVKRISRDDNTPEVPSSSAKLCSQQQPPNSSNLMSLYEPAAGQSDDSPAISPLRVGRPQVKPSLFVSSLSNLENDAIDDVSLGTVDSVDLTLDNSFSSKSMFGFRNQGNTCYINSTIQMLLGLPALTDSLVKSNYDKTSDCDLLRTFTRLCKIVKEGPKSEVNDEILRLKSVMEERDQQFVGKKMQDASEFLGRFLDELSEDFDKLEGEKNLIKENYLHQNEETYTCKECGHVTNVAVNDIAIWCDVSNVGRNKRKLNLQELLESNFVNEEREKRCDECGHTTASLVTRMVKTPEILQIYLKRYNYGQLLDGKVKNYVEIPATVNISNFSSKKSMSSLENSKHTSSFTTSDEKLSSLPVRSSNRDNGSLIAQSKSLHEEREDINLKIALNESRAEFERTSGLLDQESKDLQRALKESLEEFEDSHPTPVSTKRTHGQMSDPDQEENSRKTGRFEEEENIRRAIELSKLEFKSSSLEFVSNKSPLTINNNTIYSNDANNPQGIRDDPKFNYRVCSIVSHHGSTATSGHYVADVLRLDPELGGRWFRFDDDCVTETSLEKVLTGSNCYNGYIITYVQSS